MSRVVLAIPTAALVLAASSAVAQGPPRKLNAPHVTVELISSSPVLTPGSPTWIGLRFILEPGWHVYWVNPGDSGGPPTVLWHPAAGISPGEFEWPAPERIPYGTLVNYGYHGDVVLPVPLTATGASTSGRIEANATWLVCKDVCVSGKGRVALAFPLEGDAKTAVPGWKPLIDRARAAVPAPAPAAWRATAREEGDTLVVTVLTGKKEAGGTFFPIDAGVLDEAMPQHPTPIDRGLRFTLTKSDLLTTTPPAVRAVIALDSGPTHVVTVPVERAPSTKGRTP